MLSIRSPDANKTMTTTVSLMVSHSRGSDVGSSGRGMPGRSANATPPIIISKAVEVGRYCHLRLGIQYDSRNAPPATTTKTW
jgi:hypothetical protein